MPNEALQPLLEPHLIHHRGQLTTYLRPMGAKVPSVYGRSAMTPPASTTQDKTKMTLRIEKASNGQRTTIRLIGRMQREHLEEVKAQMKDGGQSVTLDLNEVSLVDVDVIRFLATCQAEGISLVHCSRYIYDWIAKERSREE